MGTRSVVAFVDSPDATTFKGRYVHGDGYPDGVGTALKAIVARDGVDTARKTITEDHYGWSSLHAGPAERLSPGYDDGRFVSVDGYGVAYTEEQGQSSPDDWITTEDVFESWCEYVYLVAPDGTIRAYEVPYGGSVLKLIGTDAEGIWVEGTDDSYVNIQNPRAPLYPPERVLNARGFAEYGSTTDTYGTPMGVVQSSAVVDSVWIFGPADGHSLHLDVDNVRWLRERLGEWLDDIGQPR